MAARVLDRFEEVGLVDDAEFARSLVRSRQASRGLAGRALRQELRRSGVDDETAAEALDELDPEQELATARALVAKRLPSTRGLPQPKQRGPAQRDAGPQGLPERPGRSRSSGRRCSPMVRTTSSELDPSRLTPD